MELQFCTKKITKWNVLFSTVSLLKYGTTRGYCFPLLNKIYEAVIHVCSVHFVFLVQISVCLVKLKSIFTFSTLW